MVIKRLKQVLLLLGVKFGSGLIFIWLIRRI